MEWRAHLTHDIGQTQGHEHCADAAAYEPLPGLLGADLDEGSAAHKEAEHVGHNVVDDHHHEGHDEPDETLILQICYDCASLS